jgi:hypothetical protein
MSQNGQLPRGDLSPVSGGQLLRKDAARAYLALDRYLRHAGRYGLSNAGGGSCYRKLGRPGDYRRGGEFTQWYAWERYQAGGNLAARPGTSNHGWGVAVDFVNYDSVATYGAAFGWRKTEAFGEPWHYCYVPGRYAAVREWSKVRKGEELRPGDRGPGIKAAKKLLRRHGFWRFARNSEGYSRRFGRAVRRFQRVNGLVSDGIVGPRTWAALRRPARRRT